jgi:Terminase small subunit
MAPRSGRQSATPSASCKVRARRPVETGVAKASEVGRDEIAERRPSQDHPGHVLQEYARIAFADLRRVADWGSDALVLKTPEALSDSDVAAIADITTAGNGSRQSRLKLYDKKSALDAIARHLGMFLPAARRQDGDTPEDLAEDARDVLARRLARLASGGAAE